jgi:hypothetical protein
LRPSEKELPERCSGVLCYKNTRLGVMLCSHKKTVKQHTQVTMVMVWTADLGWIQEHLAKPCRCSSSFRGKRW